MDLYQHFRKEEKPFIDEILGWCEEVSTKYRPRRSNFLDPREQDIVRAVVGDDPDITLAFWGGFPNAERKRLLMLPPYLSVEDQDFGLVLFAVNYPRKFASISHPDLLGALTGAGLKREKFGDLLLVDDKIQIVVTDDIVSYIQFHLTEVGRHPVKLEPIPMSGVLAADEDWDEQEGTVSSLRLDAVAAQMYHVTRGKIVPLIQKGKVKVNWKVVDQPAFLLHEGDHLSIRGMGRGKLLEVGIKTKKGKYHVVTGRLYRK